MKLAVIGAGIAGITSSHLLAGEHEVHLFEKNDYLGGHSNTRTAIDALGCEIPIDTGFIVCNPKNYPNFFKLMKKFKVSLRKSEMSFAYYNAFDGFSYIGPSISEFLRKPENFLRRRFWRFVYEQRKFNRLVLKDLRDDNLTNEDLGSYLKVKKVNPLLIESYINPLISSIWSGPEADANSFPTLNFATFFNNHSMLHFIGRPQWYTVTNGSRSYIQAFQETFKGTIRLSEPVTTATRFNDRVVISTNTGNHQFDKVIFATHADQALKILQTPTPVEQQLFSPWNYNKNLAVLHSDSRVLPFPRRHWASWNYVRDGRSDAEGVSITYYMNRLQKIRSKTDFFVTLNPREEIDPEKIFYSVEYEHPIYTPHSIKFQAEVQRIQGENNTYYCGAHLGYGFHEDGVRSALFVTRQFGIDL